MKKFIVKSYGKKGEDVVNKNYAAVDRGGEYEKVAVDPAWANLPDDEVVESKAPEFVEKVVKVIKRTGRRRPARIGLLGYRGRYLACRNRQI